MKDVLFLWLDMVWVCEIMFSSLCRFQLERIAPSSQSRSNAHYGNRARPAGICNLRDNDHQGQAQMGTSVSHIILLLDHTRWNQKYQSIHDWKIFNREMEEQKRVGNNGLL